MKKRKNFSSLKKQERRAKLLSAIIKKTNGELSKSQLERIVNTIDIDNQYSISIVESAKKMAEELTLYNHTEKHEWCGSDGKEEEGHVLIGKASFGEDYYFLYYVNGNIEDEEERKTFPEFDVTQPLVVHINSYTWEGYERGNHFSREENKLVIYLPEKNPFPISPEVQYILKNFNVKIE